MSDRAPPRPPAASPATSAGRRSLAPWPRRSTAAPLTRHMELLSWLKTEHGLGHGHASALVAHTLSEDAGRA
ncbi:DUF4287 domain-containing protein [Streptomyces sp. NPDC097981]|uniref:DUF4287 domain-containing protein n=1 Tax=Streptomyces sp. NPDC097981 TaxID=3155428 RepID=UPI003317D272